EIGYDHTERDRSEARLNALRDAPQRLREMEARAHDISLISAQIDNARTNIAAGEERLSEARRKAVAARQEADRFAESYREHEKT
ncbi:MAG: hypothetical protein LIO47_09870, partial [Akkermansia sp.]|nr:hypothetical protein [Akkermansia sp.]